MKPDILIVDDSPVMRRFISRVLDATGLETGARLEAGNGREGLEQLERAHVDIVLADMNMPVMDGASMVRAMRGNPSWKALPVLIVSTDRSEARAEEMHGLGVDGYVTKPFSPEQLEEKILAAFETAKARAVAAAKVDEEAASKASITAAANPHAIDDAGSTVFESEHQPTERQAVLVSQAVTEILETMCFLEVTPYTAGQEKDWGTGEQQKRLPDGPPAFAAELRFDGGIAGSLHLYADEEAARTMAANFLGEEEDDLLPAQLQQVLQELANMICGAILHEHEYEKLFTLSSPVASALPMQVPIAGGIRRNGCNHIGGSEHPGFHVGQGWIAVNFVEDTINCATPSVVAGK